jgi:hypothetical protein
MLALGPIAFAVPWVLGAVLLLPVVWWLLRLTPPAPRRVRFPAVRLLHGLIAREETPAHTPPWLLLLRLIIGALVIVALAEPVLHSDAPLPGTGPILLVIDNGWSAARDWPARQQMMADVLTRAERQSRLVVVAATAPMAAPGNGSDQGRDQGGAKPQVIGPMAVAEARRLVQGLEPQPWPEDRAATLAALKTMRLRGTISSVWLSNGLEDNGAAPLVDFLNRLGGLRVAVPEPLPDLLRPPVIEGEALTARLIRAAPGPERAVAVQLSAGDGRPLAEETATFAANVTTASVRFTLPLELRNQAARISLQGQATVAATVLLDERWRRKPVGLVTGRQGDESQPLLSDFYYLDRALAPTSEIRRGSLSELLAESVSVLILPDIKVLDGDEARMLGAWVAHGGLLLRFAGPHLAHDPDSLLPVRLRAGDRALGGALSWSKPLPLAPFDPGSPFAGLTLPADVTVERQVLAEPTVDLGDHTWARLSDGTPLVTAARRGQGSIVLVHTTAGPDWSNLALSGLFVDMLRRVVALGTGLDGGGQSQALAPLAPLTLLDGLGRLGEPPATALPILANAFAGTRVGPDHPPGFYGVTETRRALNLTASLESLAPLALPSFGVTVTGYALTGEQALKPVLLMAAFVLGLLDLGVALALRGLLIPAAYGNDPSPTSDHDGGRVFSWTRSQGRGRAGRLRGLWLLAGLSLSLLLPLSFVPAWAAADDEAAGRATAKTWLAYVVTGDAGLDQTSRAGLEGLSRVLIRRTSVDVGGVAAVSPETDELAFFPLLYWPVPAAPVGLSEAARRRINDYLHHGGTILFDSRDDQGMGAPALRAVTAGLDLPPLTPLPSNHVLTRSFYLLQDFPGRTDGGDVWVEAREDRRLDGVSSVIVGENDWAAAWAVDAQGQPLYATVPGGETQREMAYRFGVNLVMYALTGNYKADQVHVPAILRRIGQ